MAKVESSGVAKAGLATGIVGTSLAGLLTLGKLANVGGWNGWNGWNNNMNCGNPCFNNGYAANIYQSVLSEKDSEIAKLKAEKYADGVGQGVYAALNTNLKEAYGELVVTRERLATADANFQCLAASVDKIGTNVNNLNAEVANMRVREQATADAIDCLAKSTHQRFDSVYNAIDCAKRETGAAIALESERRVAGDQNLMCYVQATYVPGKLVMPREAICPEVMREYNSWVAPTATATAPATQPVTGTISVNS